MDSGRPDPDELSFDAFCRVVDMFADMGVFHMALGGGEAFERDDFLDIARYVRGRGIVPNLTTNGFYITHEIARECRVFGQVNVSIDGVGDRYREVRGIDGYDHALHAVELLKEAGVQTGINCTISAKNFNHLEEVIALARKYGLHDVELLRYKPFGRGTGGYEQMRLSHQQHCSVHNTFSSLSKKYDMPLRIDCSFLPMVCYHNPDPEIMDRMSVNGCDAGNTLLGVRSDGTFAGCSFCTNSEKVEALPDSWNSSSHLEKCRSRSRRLGEPCRSCPYLDLCKGGCRAVSEFLFGDPDMPDPECPFVYDYKR
jgi:radical SAM protein with 4Fe4S-binding SPASM domain